METPKVPEQQPKPLRKFAAAVLHIVMGPDHPLASHGDHFVNDLPELIQTAR